MEKISYSSPFPYQLLLYNNNGANDEELSTTITMKMTPYKSNSVTRMTTSYTSNAICNCNSNTMFDNYNTHDTFCQSSNN